MFGQSGLARSVLADYRDEIAGVDRQIDAVQGAHRAAVHVSQVPGFDQRRSIRGRPLRHRRIDAIQNHVGGQMNRPADERLGFVDVAGMRMDAQLRQHVVEGGRTNPAFAQHTESRAAPDAVARRQSPGRRAGPRSGRIRAVLRSRARSPAGSGRWSRSRRTSSNTSPLPSGSRSVVGSSSTIIDGCTASTEAIASRCFSPPDSEVGSRSSKPASPTAASAGPRRALICSGAIPTCSIAKATSCATLVEKSWASKS